jgi:predicted HicB family RNase H-like nuclease
MNQKTMQYKGYTASAEYDLDENCYVGEVIGIQHFILFRGASHEGIYEKFKEMIEFYLEDCAKDGIEPCKPPSITITFPPELYAQAYQKAEHSGIPIQAFMENAVQQAIS